MFQTPPHSLAPTSRQGGSTPDPQLPRGECGFILAEADPETGGRKRCVCRSFWLDKTVPGSRCECGHGAWTHEREPVGSVTMEEHLGVVERLKWLEGEVRGERAARDDMARAYADSLRSFFAKMATFVQETKVQMVRLEDKIESVMDKTHDHVTELDKLRVKLETVDEAAMELENRVERMDLGRPSRSLTPLAETPIETMQLSQLPIRDKKLPDRWAARVILVPGRRQPRAFAYDSTAFKRCESRNMNQELAFADRDSDSFVATVDRNFSPILRGRSWMPLMCYRESNDDQYPSTALRPLPPDQRAPAMWCWDFLEQQCIASDKMQGDVVYIALQIDEMSWTEIKLLPAVTPAGVSPFVTSMVDQTFWQHDDELDGPAGYKSLDSMMFDSSDPPPYSSMSSRTHSYAEPPRASDDAASLRSPLDVLASASLLDKQQQQQQQQQHPHSPRTSNQSFSTDGGGGGAGPDDPDRGEDEHRDKRTRLPSRGGGGTSHGFGFGIPGPSTSAPVPSSSAGGGGAAPALYVSGRTKRKMPTKQKEPVRISELRTPLHSLLHRHRGGGDKDEHEGPS